MYPKKCPRPFPLQMNDPILQRKFYGKNSSSITLELSDSNELSILESGRTAGWLERKSSRRCAPGWDGALRPWAAKEFRIISPLGRQDRREEDGAGGALVMGDMHRRRPPGTGSDGPAMGR